MRRRSGLAFLLKSFAFQLRHFLGADAFAVGLDTPCLGGGMLRTNAPLTWVRDVPGGRLYAVGGSDRPIFVPDAPSAAEAGK